MSTNLKTFLSKAPIRKPVTNHSSFREIQNKLGKTSIKCWSQLNFDRILKKRMTVVLAATARFIPLFLHRFWERSLESSGLRTRYLENGNRRQLPIRHVTPMEKKKQELLCKNRNAFREIKGSRPSTKLKTYLNWPWMLEIGRHLRKIK